MFLLFFLWWWFHVICSRATRGNFICSVLSTSPRSTNCKQPRTSCGGKKNLVFWAVQFKGQSRWRKWVLIFLEIKILTGIFRVLCCFLCVFNVDVFCGSWMVEVIQTYVSGSWRPHIASKPMQERNWTFAGRFVSFRVRIFSFSRTPPWGFAWCFGSNEHGFWCGPSGKNASSVSGRGVSKYNWLKSTCSFDLWTHGNLPSFDPNYSTSPWNLAQSCRVSRPISASGNILSCFKACIASLAKRTPDFVLSCTSREWNCIEWCAKLPTKQRNAINVIHQSTIYNPIHLSCYNL